MLLPGLLYLKDSALSGQGLFSALLFLASVASRLIRNVNFGRLAVVARTSAGG